MMMPLMSNMNFMILIVFFFVYDALTVAGGEEEAKTKILQVSFLHRHGARQAPTFTSDGRMTWRDADLTPAGEEMTKNLGRFIRHHLEQYPPEMLAHGPIPKYYNAKFIRSNSTDLSRTIQSGVGVLQGLFPDEQPTMKLLSLLQNGGKALPENVEERDTQNERVREQGDFTAAISEVPTVPFIYHKPQPLDYDMAFNGNFPNVHIRNDYFAAFKTNNTLAKEILTTSQISNLVAEFGGAWCQNEVMKCALFAEDVAQCQRSNGGISNALNSSFDNLQKIQMYKNQYFFGYHRTGYDAAMGSYGYPLLKEWLDQAEEALKGNTMRTEKGKEKKSEVDQHQQPFLFHYSAHDNTVIGAMNTLGAATMPSQNVSTWVPKFAQTIFVEVRSDSTLHFFEFKPNENFGTGFPFFRYPLQVECQRPPTQAGKEGEVYRSSVCSFDDIKRAVQRSQPQVTSSPAQCYLSPDDAARCKSILSSSFLPNQKKNETTRETELAAACLSYRQYCPQEACQNTGEAHSFLRLQDVMNWVKGKKEVDSNELECLVFVQRYDFLKNIALFMILLVIGLVFGIFLGLGMALCQDWREKRRLEKKFVADGTDEEEWRASPLVRTVIRSGEGHVRTDLQSPKF